LIQEKEIFSEMWFVSVLVLVFLSSFKKKKVGCIQKLAAYITIIKSCFLYY